MTDLRKLARDRTCTIRVPGGCSPDETVVACHIRMNGVSGMGIKAPDIFCAWGCYRCHGICDGAIQSGFTVNDRRLMLLEGMVRTQQILINERVLTW